MKFQITPEQAEAIRAPVLSHGHVHIGDVVLDYRVMRALLRLGLCIAESHVTGRDTNLHAMRIADQASFDHEVDDEDTRMVRMLDALSKELRVS